MKYLYQDSVELSVQRDYIKDLEKLLGVVGDSCPKENAVISAKKELENIDRARDQRISRLKVFESNLGAQLNTMIADDDADILDACKEAITETCGTCVRQQTKKLDAQFDSRTKDLKELIKRDSENIRKIFETFLEFGVYNATRSYSLISDNGSALCGELSLDMDVLSVVYELRFNEPVYVKELIGSFSIPAWSTSGLFHKENVLKILDMSNHHLVSVECTNKNIFARFEDKKGLDVVRVEMGRATQDHSILYGIDEPVDITKDETISKEIDDASVIGLMRAVIDYVETTENRATSTLKTMTFNDMDVIEHSMAYDTLKIILAEYGRIANKCIEHGVAKTELIIKIESADGTRTEKYMPISTVRECFDQVGERGAGLAGAFGLPALEAAR